MENKENNENNKKNENIENIGVSNLPLQERNNLQKLLGTDADDDSYKRLPISNFGVEMLKNMGWYEGRGLGKNPSNALINPIEYIPRHHRAGLGAVSKARIIETTKGKKILKKTELVAQSTDGKTRNYIDIGEELIERKVKKLDLNSRILIIKGKYADLSGRITHISIDKCECNVELELNEKIVKLSIRDIILYEKTENLNKGCDSEHLSDEVMDENMNEQAKKKKRHRKKLKWITPNIMIRVFSKKPQDGKLYDKKLEVIDILDDYTFTVIDEKGQIYDELREEDVETALPKLQGLVKIIKGENKGKLGMLLERNKEKNEVIIQLVDTLEILICSQDDCAQYIEKKV